MIYTAARKMKNEIRVPPNRQFGHQRDAPPAVGVDFQCGQKPKLLGFVARFLEEEDSNRAAQTCNLLSTTTGRVAGRDASQTFRVFTFIYAIYVCVDLHKHIHTRICIHVYNVRFLAKAAKVDSPPPKWWSSRSSCCHLPLPPPPV